MQCKKCGFDNPPEAQFCGQCGATMKAAEPLPSGGEAVPSGMKIGIAIGSAFVPLLGIIMGAIYMNDPNPEKKKAGQLWLLIGIGAIVLGCACFVVAGMIGNSME